MNSKLVLLAALAVTLPVAGLAQAPAAAVPADAAAAAPPSAPPTAYAAKIALVAFEQAVYATNEGQQAIETVRKKYEPKKTQMDAQAAEIDSLKKQLQAAPASMTAAERDAKLKAIDTKDKAYQRDVDDAQTAYQSEVQEALGKVAQKVNAVMLTYVEKNGYTLLLNVGSQQSQVMWTSQSPNADITEAVIAAYNAESGVAAPAPEAPAPAAKPATTPKAPAK